MKSKALATLGSAVFTICLVVACADEVTVPPTSDVDGDAAGDAGASTPDTSTGQTGECTTNADCEAKLPPTTPANCAVATCDALQKRCVFKAKDSDGDGHPAKKCSAATATIETGDDCDDEDSNTYPGAWDGPASDEDSGPNARPDRCDQTDNDCNGSPDDGKIPVDGGDRTCKCDPNKPLPCYEYPNGVPIDPSTLDADNNPKGACKKGTRTCPNGIPGTCVGAVGPTTEQCNDLDLDCNGKSGNAGDTVPSAPIWYKDQDNDGYGDKDTAPRQQCVAPAAGWRQTLPNTDCNDNDAQVNPGLAEICDSKDNNCNGIVDEGVTIAFCADADNDSYCSATCVQACTAPAGYRRSDTCLPGLDCNDAVSTVHPSAFEYCGDGVDSNCTGGDSETYANLGQGCTAGTFGVCKRTGNYVCTAAKTSTECNATAGTATSGSSAPSTDPLIDMTQERTGYNPRWDWNCNNTVEVVDRLYGGSFRAAACGGNYQSACRTFGSETECNAGVFYAKFFNCDYYPGSFIWIDPSSPEMCGRYASYIGCWWQQQPGGGYACDYIANTYTPNNNKVSCR
jgi:hypothetical protein